MTVVHGSGGCFFLTFKNFGTMKEKTIKICGKEVSMRYCAAAETGFEQMSGKSIEVFMPKISGKDEEGNNTYDAPEATTSDYIKLAQAAIIAYYARRGEKEPVSTEEILFDATSAEVLEMIKAVSQLRNEWYMIPDVIPTNENTDTSKN